MGRERVVMRPAAAEAAAILGQQIRYARQALRLTADELGARAGVSGRTVRLIEHGAASPAFGNVLNVAISAGVPLHGETDPEVLARARRTGEQIVALLPARTRHLGEGISIGANYDF